MRIGLTADSHGNVDYLVLVAERLVGQHKVDRIFHLGGGSKDVEEVVAFKKKMIRGTEEYGDDAFLADVADFLAASGPPAAPGDQGDEMTQFRRLWTVVRDEGDENGSQEKIVDMIGSHLVLAVHDPSILVAEDVLNATLILHGKAERFGAMEKKSHWFLCPGHLRDKEYQGRQATFGVLEIVPKTAKMSIFSVSGELVHEYPLTLEKKGKMTVK